MVRRIVWAALGMVVFGTLACSGDSEEKPGNDLMAASDVTDVQTEDAAIAPDGTISDTMDGGPGDTPSPADLPGDFYGIEDTLPPIDWKTDLDPLPPDVVEDMATDVVPECAEADECVALYGAAAVCGAWLCDAGFCIDSPLVEGTECSDDDPCTDGDACDGYGMCAPGELVDCDDSEFCTDDSCETGIGCQHAWKPPQPCVVGDDTGTQECDAGNWGDCVIPELCDIKINTNDTGTVNPFIFPARDGQFYVSYVASEDEGGNMKLAWVDPATCEVTEGPFTVNDVLGGAYYWGAQWALSDGNGNFYAVWEAKSGVGELGFAASESGTSFLPAVEAVSTSQNGSDPTMTVQGPGHVYIAWTGYDGNQYDPYFTTNSDVFGNNTFSPAVKVHSSPVQDDQIALAVDPAGTIYLAWQSFGSEPPDGGNMYVSKSTDDGTTWTDPVQVNDVGQKANVGKATFLAWGAGKLHIVWSDDRDDSEGDIYYDSSVDGVNFGTDVLVNDSTYRYQEDPSIMVGAGTACAGTIYVVWQDLRSNSSYDIYGTRSTDNGATFETNIPVTPTTDGDQMNPALAVDDTCKVGVSWRDSATNNKFDIRASFVNGW
jgi:hypothetical protein